MHYFQQRSGQTDLEYHQHPGQADLVVKVFVDYLHHFKLQQAAPAFQLHSSATEAVPNCQYNRACDSHCPAEARDYCDHRHHCLHYLLPGYFCHHLWNL